MQFEIIEVQNKTTGLLSRAYNNQPNAEYSCRAHVIGVPGVYPPSNQRFGKLLCHVSLLGVFNEELIALAKEEKIRSRTHFRLSNDSFPYAKRKGDVTKLH